MSEPQHQHNPSPSEPSEGAGAPGAGRFWERYGEARRPGAANGSRHPADRPAEPEGGREAGDSPRREAGDPGPRRGPGHSAPPPHGAGPAASPPRHECLEWCPICRGAEVVRAGAPPELRDQLEAIQRDALTLVRSLLDAYLARQGEPGPARSRAKPPPGGVEDIPIE